jgi:hypothetical protein
MSAFRNNNLATRAAERDRVSKAQTAMRLADADAVARRYEAAYQALHGTPIEVRYVNGWFRFKSSRYRRAEVLRMADVLEARAADLINPDEESC